ncbi:MAG: DUF6340 family protein [Bacteroidota bacterium]|nr:DUF6340 family protein [Bacteroidota bacterium]
MKSNKIFIILIILAFLLQNCAPQIKTLTIETISPSSINFPKNFNKIAFINFENDINDDGEIDSMLYKLITNEMALGFKDAIYSAPTIDTTDFLYVRGFPNKRYFYLKSGINWRYFNHISKNNNVDIFIILDSLNLTMESDQFRIGNFENTEYYTYREIAIKAFWKVYDIVEKKQLDSFTYSDTIFWDAAAYNLTNLKEKLPSIERSIRETTYFAAYDYANRIFPGWQKETRQYFVKGNKDFEKAAKLVEKNKWIEAAELWDKYLNDTDREIASRAAYNMAVASEMLGEIGLAVEYAARSYKIKNKSRTKYYIQILQTRIGELEQLKNQI